MVIDNSEEDKENVNGLLVWILILHDRLTSSLSNRKEVILIFMSKLKLAFIPLLFGFTLNILQELMFRKPLVLSLLLLS